MCLDLSWFSEKDSRKSKWDKDGLSLDEAEGALSTYYSTIYPVAFEMVEYISKNWSINRLALLKSESRNIFFLVYDQKETPSMGGSTCDIQDVTI